MAARKHRNWAPLQTLAKQREEQAMQAWQQQKNRIQQQRQQLEELRGYKAQYQEQHQQQLNDKNGVCFDPDQWQRRLNFLEQLDKAMAWQRNQLADEERRLQQCRQQWQEARRHGLSIDELSRQQNIAERTARDKQEQQALDEIATQRFVRSQQSDS